MQASHSKSWRTPKNRYQNIPARVKTAARARAVTNMRVGNSAKEKEAAQPMEASQSSNQVLAIHIGGASGKGRLRYFQDSLVLGRPVKNGLTGESLCT
jgi:hypothetical protein